MLRSNRLTFFSIVKVVLLCISIIGIWQVYRNWLNGKKAAKLVTLKESLHFANETINKIFNLENYFSFADEQQFLQSFRNLRQKVPMNFDRLGLAEDLVNPIRNLVKTFDQISALRKEYNNRFVKKEAAAYADLFNSLENYPLSADQVEAIIRDEDNNLVLAGAGTGKTTTIAGKVAYLLKKGLARPEELLILSFTKNAVNEMYERCQRFCKNNPDAVQLDVRTFNSFGYMVNRYCSTEELHLAFDGDEKAVKLCLQGFFDHLFLTDREFQKKAVNFIAFFNRPERDEFAFESRNAYLKHEQSFKNITIDGHKVNSKEEMQIGNFFCLSGIRYEYQKHYPLKDEDRHSSFGSYHPDFYLPDHDIWYEHFGIDRGGNVPSWFRAKPPFPTGRDYYQAGIKWKEGIHAKYETKLIKTYSFENKEGQLITNLKKRLISYGIEIKQPSPENILTLVKESAHYEDFINLIFTFLGLMKSNAKLPEDIRPAMGDKRIRVFMDVFRPIYHQYESRLKSLSHLDFNDMINQATRHLNEGNFQRPYKYILIDEFQDMSLGRYELLKSLRKHHPGVKLYAVGDDWQSIFRFTGSDISIIAEFSKHFGFTSQTAILKTYRFNEQILKVTSDFVQKNPAQLRKTLAAERPAMSESFSFIGSSGTGDLMAFQNRKEQQVGSILAEIGRIQSDATVFLIGRYHHNVPFNLRQLKNSYPGLNITYHTAHRVKGMTCDYAILLDVDAGTLGFPSEVADDPLLNYLLLEGDTYENAEERRVFYVAITRAKHKNYFLYNSLNPSKFLTELMDAKEFQQPMLDKCPECQGIMVRRIGPFSEFYGCTNYPLCDGKLPVLDATV